MMIIKARVKRDGQLAEVHSEQLVPGDVVAIEAGDIVPADGRLLRAAWAWQVERMRNIAAAAGSARADVLQYHHTYLRMRTDIPDRRFSPDGEIGVADGSILSYLRAEPGMTLVAYSPLLNGAYTPSRQGTGPRLRPSGDPRPAHGTRAGRQGDRGDGEPGSAGLADRRRAARRAAHRCILSRPARREPGRRRSAAQRGAEAAAGRDGLR